jgi:single-strand DNA-binding protein
MDINSVSLTGRLVRDAELKTTPNGKDLVNFTLASNTEKDHTDFIDCTVWGAEKIRQYLVKGKRIAITGKMRHETWEKDGQKHSRVKVSTTSFNVCLMDGGTTPTPASAPSVESVTQPQVVRGAAPSVEQDVPF